MEFENILLLSIFQKILQCFEFYQIYHQIAKL